MDAALVCVVASARLARRGRAIDGGPGRELWNMSTAASPEFKRLQQEEAAPSWSGVPVIAGNCMILPLHVADMRQITFGPEWAHIDHWPNEGGDVEYHVFRRIDRDA